MQRPPILLRLLLPAIVCVCAATLTVAQQPPSKLGLVIGYQREKSELAKRDIALKMIDSGLLKLGETTEAEVAKIFGKDWTGDLKVAGDQSYGIIRFSSAPESATADAQAPRYGWYMVVYYNTTDRKVFDWDLSNVSK
jgi:hypothetical protein